MITVGIIAYSQIQNALSATVVQPFYSDFSKEKNTKTDPKLVQKFQKNKKNTKTTIK